MAGDVQILDGRPPTRLIASILTPDGHRARWADDAALADLMSDLTFSTTMPGGFEQCSLSLNRDPRNVYPDLERLAHLVIRSPGGRVAWEGRLDKIPDTGGTNEERISPSFVGYQAHLQDDTAARMIFIDCAQGSWTGASVQRQKNLLSLVNPRDVDDGGTQIDPTTALPALTLQFAGSWSRQHASEMWYDAQGIPLGALYYAWHKSDSIVLPDANWSWQAFLSTDDVATTIDGTGNLSGASPTGVKTAATGANNRAWAGLELDYLATTAFGGEGVNYSIYWTYLGVLGNHHLPVQGTLGSGGGIGLLASDVVPYIIGTWAPDLRFTVGAEGTIRPSTFIIPQLAFRDATTASEMLTQTNAFDAYDWAVWDNRTFYWAPRDTFAKRWRARIEDAHLQETGKQVSKLFNGVIVSYSDVTGVTRTVGPPGSDSNIEDPALQDFDPMNPCNQAGPNGQPLQKWGLLSMGTTSTSDGAIQIGKRWLQEQRLIDRSGQATLEGWVQNSDTGMWHPSWHVRAGDLISFYDAGDPHYRRIIRTDYTHNTRANAIQLDAPPDGIAELLSRMAVVVQGLGVGL